MLTPVEIVERQFAAYNERNLEKFLANFSEAFESYRMPATAPSIVGKAALADFYATQRFNRSELRAELVSRVVMGTKVIDCERIWGLGAAPVETVAVFEVRDGLIQRAWFFSAT